MSDAELPVAATLVLVRDGAAGPEVLMLRRPDRGSFAGAWVFPGGKVDEEDRVGSDADEIAVARIAAVRETREEVGLTVAPERLLTVSRWVPPEGIALRIRTWFFAAPDPGGAIRAQEDEVEEHRWVRPSAALERHAEGGFRLYPPTWMTLYGMSDQHSAEAVLAEMRLGGIRLFDSKRHPRHAETLLWPGGMLRTGALPWTFTRREDA